MNQAYQLWRIPLWRIIFLGIMLGQLDPMIVSVRASTGTIHVAPTGSDIPGCGTMEMPCRTIQFAVDVASSGDTIKLAQGTYTGTGSAVVSLIYSGSSGKNLTFIGGFVPPNWTTPLYDPTKTILDGQNMRHGVEIISVPAITVTMQGLTIQNGYASSPVPYSGEYSGGGLVCRNDDPNTPRFVSLNITNVIFRNNRVQSWGNRAASGGGMSLYLRCRATLADVIFDNNSVTGGDAPDGYCGASALGGGLFATQQSDVTGTRVTFTNNSVIAGSGGTGICSDGWSTPDALGGGAVFQLNNVSIEQITATNNSVLGGNGSQRGGTGAGGGIFFEFSTAWIRDGMVKGNSASGGNSDSMGGIASGGGIMASDSTLMLERLKIINNTSSGGSGNDGGDAGGGGMYFTRVSTSNAGSTTGTNLILADNITQAGLGNNRWGGGGAIFNQNTTLTLIHTTIAQNSVLSTMQGPAIVSLNYLGSSSINLQYSIVALHGNTGAAVIIQKMGDVGVFDRTLFFGNQGGNYGCQPGMSGCTITSTNQITGDPAFVSPGSPNFDYRISRLSAAKDIAMGSTIPLDIYKQARPCNFVSDVGAHEYCDSSSYPFSLYLPLVIK
jgi:hypothetical protein